MNDDQAREVVRYVMQHMSRYTYNDLCSVVCDLEEFDGIKSAPLPSYWRIIGLDA